MSLNFVTGRPTLNHRKALLLFGQHLVAKKGKNEAGSLFFVVPDHIKFSEEVALLKEFNTLVENGNAVPETTLQTFSFSRLAWYFLQNTAYYGQKKLSDAGQTLLLKKVVMAQREQLVLLKSQVEAPGFIAQLRDLFAELKQGAITPDVFSGLAEISTMQVEEQLKLREVYLLYVAYCAELDALKLESKSNLEALANVLPVDDAEKRVFIFYGYDQFSNEERGVIEALLKSDVDVVVSSPKVDNAPELIDWQKADRDSLRAFYHQELAGEAVVVSAEKILNVSAAGSSNTPGDKLGQAWLNSLTQSEPAHFDAEVADYLNIYQAETLYDEVVGVAKQIKKVVRDGARYKDITLYVRELTEYGQILRQVFYDNAIPVNLATEDAMKDHPLVEFFASLFLVNEHRFASQDVMRLLKTELLPLTEMPSEFCAWQEAERTWRDQLDQFETLILKNGFTGSDFTKGDWQLLTVPRENSDGLVEDPRYQAEVEAQSWSNGVRGKLVAVVQSLFVPLKKAQNGREAATILYHFLESSGVKKQLERFENEAVAAGDLRQAKNHQQTWQEMCHLLDDYVYIFGDEPFSLAVFSDLLQTGLNSLSYEQIPQTLDQVEVDQLENVTPVHSDYVFALGLNDTVFPKQIQNTTLLTDDEREKIQEALAGKSPLNFETKRENQKENLRMYHLLMSGNRQVTLSFAAQLESGSVKLSKFVERIERQFKLVKHSWHTIKGVEDDGPTLQRLSTYRQLVRDYLALVSQSQQAETDATFATHPFWQSAPSVLRQSPVADIFAKLEQTVAQKNNPTNLTPEEVDALYGTTIAASVSKMESFYQCEYKYFLNYGLRLKEREILDLNPQVTGQFFHQVLDEMFKILAVQGKRLGQLTDAELSTFIKETLDLVFVERRYQLFNRTPRMQFIKEKLVAIVKKMATTMNYQQAHTNSQPVSTEWRFDNTSSGLVGPQFQLPAGHSLALRGIIDRVDVTMVSDQPYLTVVDYKSSAHKFSFSDAYYGLAMQMLTYLDVVLEPKNQSYLQDKILTGQALRQAANFEAAGALYLHIFNPELKAPVKDVEHELRKKMRYAGFLVNDTGLLTEMDPDIASTSEIYPIKATKSGISVTKGESVDAHHIPQLLDLNNRNLLAAGEKMVTGTIALNPVNKKGYKACTYCPFRSICQFDPSRAENNYRKLTELKKEDVLQKLAEHDAKKNNLEGK